MISVIENARERSQYSNMLTDLALKSGLDAVGVSSAEPFTDVRIELERRRSAGLHAEMQFTFRNPERSTTPTRILEGAKSLIVGALRTNSPNLPEAGPGKMKIGAYARCDYYSILRSALNVVAEQLLEDGWKSRVVADDNSLVDRAAAVRAGIGWYGKNGNVLIPGRGSWFVLGSVVTNAPLSVDTPISKGCGSCTSCIDECPTGAIVAPGVVDARRCLAWLLQAPGEIPIEFRKAVGVRIYGCDDCQEVCPVGKTERRNDSASSSHEVAIIEILEASDEELLDTFGAWYIANREPRYLRRNALVAIGNSKTPIQDRILSVLCEYLENPDPLLRAHAVWAASNIGRSDLLEKVFGDSDQTVRKELERLPEFQK